MTTTNRLAHDLDNILGRTESLWSELRGERFLITGATGFFGCWLLRKFCLGKQPSESRSAGHGTISASPDSCTKGSAPRR